MADVVTTTTLENSSRWLVQKFTNFSDGTGEAGVVKVNAAAAFGNTVQGQTFFPGVHLKIKEIQYDIGAMAVRVQWVATTNQDIVILKNWGVWDFGRFQGLIVPSSLSGATGNIAFTTVGAAANSSYTITMWMIKGVPQS